MKINTHSVLKFNDRFIKELKAEELNKVTYSNVTNLSRYKKALEIIETKRAYEDKELAISLIENTINEMEEKKIPILVDNLIFAIGYPESYKLVRNYYDLLTTTCLNSKRFMKFDGNKFSPFQTKGEEIVKNKIKQLEQATYTLFMPLFENDDFLKTDGQFDKRAIENINYKNKILRIGENEILRDQKKALEIYYALLNSNKTLAEICEEYKMASDTIHVILKGNLKPEEYRIVLEILKKNSLKRYYEMQHVIELLYNYIPNGINIDGQKVPFSMIDYYSITNLNPAIIIDEMNKKSPSNKEEAIARAICRKYLSTNKKQGPFINKDILVKGNIRIIVQNKEYNIEDYADEIINTFKENGIPCYSNLLEQAFKRISHEIPMIPLKQKEETIKMGI